MIIAMTGGSGFIGRHLARRLLAAGHSLRVLTRKPCQMVVNRIQYFVGDLTETRSLNEFLDGADVLYHCAGETQNKNFMHNVHVQGTKNLLKAANGKIEYWVQLSSVGVYGPIQSGIINETTSLDPHGIYERTKSESDRLAISAHHDGQIKLTLLRPSNVFGPDMTRPYLFKIISLIEQGLFFYIGHNSILSNIHVENVVEALLLAGMKPPSALAKPRVFLLSDELPIEVYVGILASELGVKVPQWRLPESLFRMLAMPCDWVLGERVFGRKIDAIASNTIYDSQLIKGELGYRHVKSLKTGLVEMVATYKQRKVLAHG
jgi:nucleoside-diphosphate-sugar epimerase